MRYGRCGWCGDRLSKVDPGVDALEPAVGRQHSENIWDRHGSCANASAACVRVARQQPNTHRGGDGLDTGAYTQARYTRFKAKRKEAQLRWAADPDHKVTADTA